MAKPLGYAMLTNWSSGSIPTNTGCARVRQRLGGASLATPESGHLSAKALLGLRVSAVALGKLAQFEDEDDEAEVNILAKDAIKRYR
jgi:hypothetical protein